MKTKLKNLVFTTKLILLATPLLFNQAYAVYSGGCGTLHFIVPSFIYQKFLMYQNNPVVNHGGLKGCDEVDINTGECTNFVFAQTDLAYGPDINIELKERNSNKFAEIRIQQNYCFFEGGHITVEPKKGKFTYTITEGSFQGDKPGVVTIHSIEAQ